jgi:hypothetical protein
MDQDWGDWGGEDGDYHGDSHADAGETADLGDPDEPLASGYGEHDGGFPGDGGEYGGDSGEAGDPGDPGHLGGQPGGGFLEDDPMGSFDTGDTSDGHDAGDAGHPGDLGDSGDGLDPDDAGPDAGPDAFDHAPDTTDGPDDTTADPESVVGADPDVDPDADWSPEEFPAQLDFAAPEPVDGYPWSDPSAVAAPGTGGDDPAAAPDGAPPAQDLLDYAGAEGGADPWSALVGSDDPATSSLGRWWSPG